MEDHQNLNRAVIYKGCTRPAMLFGVPIIPFLLGVGGTFLLGFILISPPFSLLSIITWWVFKELCKNDDQFFSLYYIKMITKLGHRNAKYWKATTFQPINYRAKTKK